MGGRDECLPMILSFATQAELLEYLDSSREQRMQHLADTVAAWPLEARREFLQRWQERHGAVLADDLRARLRAIWARRGESAT